MKLSGLNQRLMPVTPARLNRWMLLVARSGEPLCLSPVTVLQYSIMQYAIRPTTPTPIPEDSSEQLPPGNYGWYSKGNSARNF